jgi:hypothetical protein
MSANRKKYMREYMRKYAMERYYRKKQELIERLGGKCRVCGSTDSLQFDHKNHGSKDYEVTTKMWWSKNVDEEVAKCQLLCKSCHTLKSIGEKGHTVAKGTHGTLSAYRYCKCDLCREANAKYCRDRKLKLKNAILPQRLQDRICNAVNVGSSPTDGTTERPA